MLDDTEIPPGVLFEQDRARDCAQLTDMSFLSRQECLRLNNSWSFFEPEWFLFTGKKSKPTGVGSAELAFCGEEFFRHELPFDRSSMTRWRQRMGEERIMSLLQESLSVAVKTGAMRP
jgi:hypothetical protein